MYFKQEIFLFYSFQKNVETEFTKYRIRAVAFFN